MKAMFITDFGGPEVFEARDVAKPTPRPDELLVRVHATSINPVDYKIRQAGAWAGIVPPAIIGYDVSGVVEAVGSAVRTFNVGDDVYYSPDIFAGTGGSYAEYHVAHASIVARKPVNLSHVEAAAIPLAGCTAFDALLLKALLRVGETVLIHGAGGVGALAIQIAKAAGTYVVAVCSDYMLDTAHKLGADTVINYKADDFVPQVREATDGFGVDVVLDTVGGDLLTRSIEVTKAFGRMVGIVGTDASLKAAFPKNIDVYPTFMQRAAYKLKALADMIERGQINPVIDHVLPLDQVAEAHRRLERGGVKGKIVLQVAP